MSELPVVENPRRRKARRTPQRRADGRFKKSAGSRTRRRRRRNPALATVVGNPRRRRRRPSGTSRRVSSGFSQIGSLFDFESAGLVTAGMISQRYLPGLIGQQLGIKVEGVTGYLVRAGTGLALGYLVKRFAGARYAKLVVTGAMASLLLDVFDERVAPAIGLSRMSGYYETPAGATIQTGFPDYGGQLRPGRIVGASARRSRIRARTRERI